MVVCELDEEEKIGIWSGKGGRKERWRNDEEGGSDVAIVWKEMGLDGSVRMM